MASELSENNERKKEKKHVVKSVRVPDFDKTFPVCELNLFFKT